MAPYVILSAAFATLNSRLGLPPFSLFFIAMSLTDGMCFSPHRILNTADSSSGMTLTFFLQVTDTGLFTYNYPFHNPLIATRDFPGSWLEIGQTISFFVITSTLLVFSAGICAFGEWLMSSSGKASIERKVQ